MEPLIILGGVIAAVILVKVTLESWPHGANREDDWSR